MGGRASTADLDDLVRLLHQQWDRLRAWVGELDQDAVSEPSVLGGWTVAELVAHLGRAMDALGAAGPAAAGAVPLTLAEYLGTYPGRAGQIREVTSALAQQIAADPLPQVDRMAAAAFARLDELRAGGGDPVVQARRGPILLSEMVVSRLIELVVHADDLVRSTRRTLDGPIVPAALTLVGAALLEIVTDRGGWDLEVVDERAWVRLACGRVAYGMDTLSAALATRWTSDSLPDLGAMLPLL